MAIDQTRVAFITREYAYETASDFGVRAQYTGTAREIVLETNLTQADASTFALQYLAETKAYPYSFEIGIEGVLYLDDFQGSPPRYTINFPGYPVPAGRVFRIVRATMDYLANTTTLVIKS